MTKRRKNASTAAGGELLPADGGEQLPQDSLAGFARMVSDLVHEFRTPLGAIVGSATTLDDYADHIDAETRSKLCAGIVDQAQRLDHLLTGLAALARTKTGRLIGEESRVELNELLRGLSMKACQRHNLATRISVLPHDIFLLTDSMALQALVFAMLDLASVFSPENGRLELSLSEDDGFAQLQLVSSVRDDGALRLDELSGGSAYQGHSRSRIASHIVFIAAIREVVHILGGETSIKYDGGEARLCQTVKLPTESA